MNQHVPTSPHDAPDAHAADEVNTSSTSSPDAGSPAQQRPRTGPIVWGALILVFCAYVVQRTLAPNSIDTAGWITATIIGVGALLLIVGIAVVIRGRK